MVLAINHISQFAFVEPHEKAITTVSRDVLLRLIADAPSKIHTVLTDKGERFRAPAFECACARNDIEHRTTKAGHL